MTPEIQQKLAELRAEVNRSDLSEVKRKELLREAIALLREGRVLSAAISTKARTPKKKPEEIDSDALLASFSPK